MFLLSFRRYMRIPHELKPSQIFKQDSLSPNKIALQIILLQIFYYVTASILFYCWAKLFGYDLQIKNWLFSWEYINYDTTLGLSLCILWLLDSLICVIFLTVIVGRSKLAWDFAVTIHAINLIIVLITTGKVPSFSWFLLQLLSSLILVFLSTWTTRWKELRDTFFEGLVDPAVGSAQVDAGLRSSANDGSKAIELKDLEAQK
ncbi:hypothetical protein HG536_0E04320 [Torulaspora globosa]|uniref:Uncharacterized protein n=1 Tax=Torulaspora globosa TaxID=48254 RepID=A0A7G3ZJ35_9SACH|nr:uncharacterized protein HG536_0E04320 [Torulaspora globosa]QLL33521.1 hypothetical protein HG536_0E04320 [Torulaspora globosa]